MTIPRSIAAITRATGRKKCSVYSGMCILTRIGTKTLTTESKDYDGCSKSTTTELSFQGKNGTGGALSYKLDSGFVFKHINTTALDLHPRI